MIQRHLDTIKGFGGSAVSLAAVAVSHATVNSWLQTASLVIGITVGLVTLADKFRSWDWPEHRNDEEDDDR